MGEDKNRREKKKESKGQCRKKGEHRGGKKMKEVWKDWRKKQ